MQRSALRSLFNSDVNCNLHEFFVADEAEARFYQVCEQLVMRLDSSSCKHCCLWSLIHGFPRDWGSGEVRRLGNESYRCCRSPEFPCDCDVVHAKFPAGSLGKVLRGGSS